MPQYLYLFYTVRSRSNRFRKCIQNSFALFLQHRTVSVKKHLILKGYKRITIALGYAYLVFYAKLGEEAGAFDYADVVNALCDKLVYRHPHIYGEVHADTPEEVKANWEALKLRKKNRRSGTLGGVPVSLPALVKAYRIGEKAAATGFDWEKKEDVWAKVKEETAEVEAEMTSGDRTAMEEEFGDLLFALVNACRLYGIDPESALERSNKKFMNRFNYMEECASSEGHTLHELSLDRMEELWQQAKHAAAEKE